MISWIQTIIQRHHKWLFGALLLVIIVAFVFTVGAVPGLGNPNRSEYTRNFLGFNLSSQQVQQELGRGVELTAILNGRNPQQLDYDSAAKQRAVMLYLADTLQIPEPTEPQLAELIRSLPAFVDPQTGAFSNNQYTSFVDSISNANSRYNQEVVLGILAQNWRIERAGDAISGPGYVLPYLAERQEAETRTVWSVGIAKMASSNFKTTVNPTEDEIKTFFEQAGERYMLPAQISAAYVYFPADKYLADIPEPTEDQLDAYYMRNISKWEKTDDGAAKPLDEIKETVAAAWKQPQAVQKATEAASQLTVDIYKAYTAKKITQGDEAALLAYVKDAGYDVQTTPPFSAQELPQDFPPQAAQAAMELTDRRLYSDAVPGPKGAYVVFRGEETPATMPELDAVRDRVVADYTAVETNRAFTEFGQQVHDQLQQAVDNGGSFSAVAKKLGFTAESYNDFTITEMPEGFPRYYFYQLMDMKQGQVSQMLRLGTDAVFLYVAKRQKPDAVANKKDLDETLQYLGQMYAQATAQGIVRDLVVVGDKMATPEEF
ncbi:MAG: peptidyl-prolyl cis-trans isomerase [Verrucomicrobiota bacterium JB024]|nr:peptidyl-prolyl cis-trans isomerase [Verrucomicrobiota bacterium JB024]